ncbi:DUF368 domain-containing protein [Namhaeicola litoreus]|uniref:DUF368 domain-containing protein n=1 Tax=Namhaeicola litoreus TaxID=1052145 RepID=A0ABW3Y794_9FLAO
MVIFGNSNDNLSMVRNLKNYLVITLKGIAMGAADVVPGVSGGTIAFVAGIYEELIDTISKINFGAIRILKKKGFIQAWKHINGNFLLALGIGIFISILSLAKVIKYLIENEAVLVWSFFFGLVLASVFYIGKQIQRWNLGLIIILLAGAIAAFYITKIPPQQTEITNIFIFFSGALAICAMILPGISGSFILLLLGAYKPVLDAIHDKNYNLLFFLGLGAVIGLLSFSKLLKWLFDHYERLTLAVLTGFIIGSLNKIWPWKKVLDYEMIDGKMKVLREESVSPFAFEGDNRLLLAIGLFLIGMGSIFLLEQLAKKKKV